MHILKDVTDAFLSDQPKHKHSLFSVDYFFRLTQKIRNVDPDYFSLYFTQNHPLEKVKYEHTFIGVGGAYRSKRELDGFAAAYAYITELCQKEHEFSKSDLLLLNRLLCGLPADSDMPLFNSNRSEVKKIITYELMYVGAKPQDFDEGIDFIVSLINKPPALHPLLLSSLVHYLLVFLHPFANGNGRTARMLSTYIMKKYGYDLMHSTLEQYYVLDNKKYQDALAFSGDFYKTGAGLSKVLDWNEYFLKSLYQACKDLFLIKVACKIAAFKLRLFGKDNHIKTLVCPVPDGVPLHLSAAITKRYGSVVGKWAYTDADGQVIAWRVRFSGTEKSNYIKSFLFFQYFSDATWQVNHIQYLGLLPMYGLAKLRAAEGKILIICEGEKSADAVEAIGGKDRIIGLSWATGAFQSAQTDWAPLGMVNADIYMWRDNDESGEKAEEVLCGILQGHGCKVKILPQGALRHKPQKWDVADALAEGMNAQLLEGFLAGFTDSGAAQSHPTMSLPVSSRKAAESA